MPPRRNQRVQESLENNRPEQLVEDEDLGDEFYNEIPRQRQRPNAVDNNRRWESGMRTEILEFHGSLQAEELLDWLAMVEEILDFKWVPEDKRVPLVATRLRDRATAWWQQSKLTRTRLGKDKIATSEKMRKHMQSIFLPYNFQRLMYQRLQNLRQGVRSVDDYTVELYQLIARNDIQEAADQLVASWGGGNSVAVNNSSVNKIASSSSGSGVSSNNKGLGQFNRSAGGIKSFGCGEVGHRLFECKKTVGKKALFLEADDYVEEDRDIKGALT
ncbi:conserved hypothetical protein [Ricinus communis]|uniref:Retrotransposon gag domain-containing protein n=1 Tax=Ricinus communis TaxID=3988 RepID=B9T8W0_RICCO|nr:conserved hypothetical protein [Ricinus communis]